jgi:hypothetical protein
MKKYMNYLYISRVPAGFGDSFVQIDDLEGTEQQTCRKPLSAEAAVQLSTQAAGAAMLACSRGDDG